jgi:hypothetical protein
MDAFRPYASFSASSLTPMVDPILKMILIREALHI